MATYNCVSIGSGKGLLPGCIKALLEPMLAYHQTPSADSNFRRYIHELHPSWLFTDYTSKNYHHISEASKLRPHLLCWLMLNSCHPLYAMQHTWFNYSMTTRYSAHLQCSWNCHLTLIFTIYNTWNKVKTHWLLCLIWFRLYYQLMWNHVTCLPRSCRIGPLALGHSHNSSS